MPKVSHTITRDNWLGIVGKGRKRDLKGRERDLKGLVKGKEKGW